LGQDIRQHLALDDVLFTLKLTPNLAHCLGIHGVARELSALTGAPLLQPAYPAVPCNTDQVLPVDIAAPDLCGRFSGRVVRFVNPLAPTPGWMVDRLARCGQRSVSALVDISNYVMFELGRPTHIFDLEKIKGGLQVRWGRKGETLKLLNGQTVEVDSDVGVISDEHQVESLAGIMGGDATAVGDSTQHIYIEAAFWWPKSVAGRSRRFNFSTDAGHRFERGVDPSLTVEHIERITQLVLDICGTPESQCGPIDDLQPNMPRPLPVQLRVARAAKVLGMGLHDDACMNALVSLGLSCTLSNGVITVVPPLYRFDLQIEEDLIEEVARMIGFDQLPTTPPQAPIAAKLRPESQRNAHSIRHSMAALGYQETINFSFVSAQWETELLANPDPVKLVNPIASNMGVMRSSLIGSLLQVVKFNLDRRAERVRVFEIGRVFRKNAQTPNSDITVAGFDQPIHIAAIAVGPLVPLQWAATEKDADFFDVKADLQALLSPLEAQFHAAEHPALHPGRCAAVTLRGQTIGHIGELHPKHRQSWGLAQAPVLFELTLDPVLAVDIPVFKPVSKFPVVERDLAVVVGQSVTHNQLMQAVFAAPTHGLLRDAVLFDIYQPDQAMANLSAHEKSLAIRLTLGSEESTLTDERIQVVVDSVLSSLTLALQARLR
jgi:phenylalanyl-tRNA synthetase beta chain